MPNMKGRNAEGKGHKQDESDKKGLDDQGDYMKDVKKSQGLELKKETGSENAVEEGKGCEEPHHVLHEG